MRNINRFEKADSEFFSDGKGGFRLFEFLLWLMVLVGLVWFWASVFG